MKQTVLHSIRPILILLLFLPMFAGTGAEAAVIDKGTTEVGICPSNLPYYWRGEARPTKGTYTYDKTLPNGDIERYTLILYDMPFRTISVKILQGQRTTILSKTYDTPGTYTDTIHNTGVQGCDTLVRINVQYGDYFHHYDTIHICQDEAWPVWHNIRTTKPGTYFDKKKGTNGRDSIYQLQLYKHYSVVMDTTIYVCSPQRVYYMNGQRISQDGYYDSDVKSPYGCDSTVHAHILFVDSPEPIVDTVFFCGNLTIIRQDTSLNINKETEVYDTIRNACGCDSIRGTYYKPYPTHLIEEIYQVYTDKPFSVDWRGKDPITEIGVYYDTLMNQYGCDSVYQLRVIPKTDEYVIINTCIGESTMHGNAILGDTITITKDTVIIDTLKNEYGGDSLIHTTYNFVQAFHQSQSITICSNQYVRWKGHIREGEEEEIVLHEAGVYRDEHRSMDGCDSSYTMVVTVLPASIKDTVLARCNDSISENPIVWTDSKGVTHRWSRHNTDTIIGDTMAHTMPEYLDYDGSLSFYTGGCDSIVRWRIVTGDFCSPRERIPLCPNSSVTVDEIEYTQTGIYYNKFYSHLNLGVLDSVHNFEIYQAYPKEEYKEMTIRELQTPYMYHDAEITKDSTYTVTLTSHEGCDSVVHMTVTVIPTHYSDVMEYIICPNDSNYFRFPDGRQVNQPGFYADTLYEEKYDSIIRIHLSFVSTQYYQETALFLQGQPYIWQNHQRDGADMVFYEEGVYWDSCVNMFGCDSIYRLELRAAKPFYALDPASPIIMCSHELPFTWHGKQITSTGTYFDSCMTVFGLDSVWEAEIIVNRDTVVQWHKRLCKNESYEFFGHTLSTPGVYHSDTFPRSFTGCDSIIELILQPATPQEAYERYTLCEGDFVRIGDSIVTTAGMFTDTTTSAYGCDSIVHYVVSVGKKYFFSTEQMINPGSSYTWHKNGQPVVYTSPGTYWDSCKTVSGCDSIYKLTLRFNEAEYIFPTDTDYVCSADLPYVWHHRTLTQTGLYYDSLQTDNGRDSVYSLYLTVYTTMRTREKLNYCDGERPVINGTPYVKDAVFTDTLVSQTGCDSIVDYVVHFYPKYTLSTVVYLHDGETYTFGDTVLATSGIYTRHFQSQYGCDSIVTVNVKACPAMEEVVIHHELCQGDQLTIGDKIITTSGTYQEVRTSVNGCDSMVRHIVNVHTAYLYSTAVSICKGGSYLWTGHHHDTILTQQGVYYDSLTTIHGCDSIYRLILNYKRTDLRDTIVSICEADLPYMYKGRYYYVDSTYYDTLGINVEGCDSIIRWHYEVNTHCSDYAQYSRCPNQMITIDGVVVNKAGVYEQHHMTADGKDSLYRFTVHDVPQYEFSTAVSGCDSVVYAGRTFYARGKGQETFTVDLNHRSSDGCDSIEHLILTINMSAPARVFSKTIADYDSVRFGPYYYNTSGTYTLHYTNSYGCDSAEVLVLTVLETEHPDIEHYFLCEGDTKGLEIFGRHFYPTEEYTYITDTTWVAGQPVIRTADIVIQHPFSVISFDPDENQIVCSAHEVLFYVRYATLDLSILPDYYDVDFYVGDIEAHPLHQTGNVDGKTTLPIMLGGQGKYVSPGNYRYRLKLHSEACVVSDTILEGSIVVRYPSNVMESAWNDAVMLVNEDFNGGSWAFKPPYKWQVYSAQGVDKTALVAGDVTQPYLYSPSLEEGDRITAFLIREGYETPIPSCEYVFTPTLTTLSHGILIYPSAVKAHMPVTVSSEHAGRFRLSDQTGRTWTEGAFGSGETQITMPDVPGCYIIVTEDEKGSRKVQKLMVY